MIDFSCKLDEERDLTGAKVQLELGLKAREAGDKHYSL